MNSPLTRPRIATGVALRQPCKTQMMHDGARKDSRPTGESRDTPSGAGHRRRPRQNVDGAFTLEVSSLVRASARLGQGIDQGRSQNSSDQGRGLG